MTALGHAQQTPLRLLAESVGAATDVAVQVRLIPGCVRIRLTIGRKQLAQKIGGHLKELEGTATPLRLSVVLQFLRDVTSGVDMRGDIQPWDIIGMFITRIATDMDNLLPQIHAAIEENHVVHSMCHFTSFTRLD